MTIWDSVPALMEMLAEQAAQRPADVPSRPGTLRLVLMSGDWIPVSLPERIRALSYVTPDVELMSLGGATEASIWSIYHPISAADVAPGARSIPYGRPMANQTFHVLDAQLRPRPTWVPGQLYIGGIGLAQGYWRDRRRPRRASSRIRAPASASTAPATSAATCRTATSSSSAARTPRSRSAAIASSWARSRPRWSATRACATPWSWCATAAAKAARRARSG